MFPKGGLGNQLFIYATGRALSLTLGVPLILDLSWFRYHADRKFELSLLVTEHDSVHAINSAGSRWRGLSSIGSKLYSAKELIRAQRKTVISELGFQFDPRVSLAVPGDSIVGYFQSWKYFNEHATSIRQEILSCFPSGAARMTGVQFEQQDNTLAIHVRLGDYTKGKASSFHGVLPIDYYSRAFNEIENHMKVARVLLLSDDPVRAELMLEELSFTDLEVRPKESAWHALEIMSMSSALIMANSSLSWWGAWLGGIDKRLCLYPEPWFAQQTSESSDLIPQGWLSIPRW